MDKAHTPLMDSLCWSLILAFVIIFWPNDPGVEIRFGADKIVTTMAYAEAVLIEQEMDATPYVLEIEPIRKPKYGFTDEEIYLMTVLLSGSKYVDGDGEYDIDYGNRDNYEQISLVLSVVMNRINSSQFPDTISEVIWQRNQFSPMTRWTKGLPKVSDISYNIVKAWCYKYDNYIDVVTIPDKHLYFWGNGRVNTSRERWYN